MKDVKRGRVHTQKVKFILPWQDYELGDVAEFPMEQAAILIRRAIVEPEDEPSPIIVP